MLRRRSAAFLAAALLLTVSGCRRGDSGGAAAGAEAEADSTLAAVQKRDTLPTGVSADTQKVDSAATRETPQQDQDDTP
jgi:hypothetical protein